jgi:hypothetical protein
MGLVVTLKIAELDDNRMFLKRSRFPKAMGGMLLGLSLVFLVMYKAASVYLLILHNSPAISDKVLFFAIVGSFLIFPLLGLLLLFYDKNIVVDKRLEEICIRFRFFYIPIRRIRAGHWLLSLRGKDLGKFYFDRHPKEEEILSYAENLSRLTSKKVIVIQ